MVRTQRAAARPDDPRALIAVWHRDESPSQEPTLIQLDDCALDDVFPSDHIRATESSLENLGVDTIDLRQKLHAWSDRWASDDRWQRAHSTTCEARAWSVGHQRQPLETTNVVRALDTGLVDCVQVVYNIFDQDPEDVLFPHFARSEASPSSRECPSTKAVSRARSNPAHAFPRATGGTSTSRRNSWTPRCRGSIG